MLLDLIITVKCYFLLQILKNNTHDLWKYTIFYKIFIVIIRHSCLFPVSFPVIVGLAEAWWSIWWASPVEQWAGRCSSLLRASVSPLWSSQASERHGRSWLTGDKVTYNVCRYCGKGLWPLPQYLSSPNKFSVLLFLIYGGIREWQEYHQNCRK